MPLNYPLGNQPGWKPGSIAYHGDDGGCEFFTCLHSCRALKKPQNLSWRFVAQCNVWHQRRVREASAFSCFGKTPVVLWCFGAHNFCRPTLQLRLVTVALSIEMSTISSSTLWLWSVEQKNCDQMVERREKVLSSHSLSSVWPDLVLRSRKQKWSWRKQQTRVSKSRAKYCFVSHKVLDFIHLP